MSIFRKLFAVLFLLLSLNVASALNDTVKCLVTNFTINPTATNFSFDLYVLRVTPGDFRMGNSSFYFRFNPGALGNAVLSNVNPKYTIGNPSYLPMQAVTYLAINRFAAQVHNIGLGEIITNNPGPTGFGERVCTITMDILNTAHGIINWDLVNSGVVNPLFISAEVKYDGSYNGPLPVELASFSSSIYRNNVTLNWATATETNNSGFEIERKLAGEATTWRKMGFVEGNGNSTETKSYAYNDTRLNAGKYNYRLKQIDYNGNYEYFELQNEIEIGLPLKFELSQNYPNPFNPATKINFSLPKDAKVTLSIYDVSGRLISTLINNEFRTANYYTVDFNASDLSSGTYFYRINAGSNIETKKMLLIK